MSKIKYPVVLFIVLTTQYGCRKYLDAKPDLSLTEPTTVSSLQGILDYSAYMNQLGTQASEVAADNYYLTDEAYLSLPADRMRRAYLWGSDIFSGYQPDDWQNEYTTVYNANIVLENLEKIDRNNENANQWDNCKGQALVFRAKSFYEIAQVWALAYDSLDAANKLGIPLRLSSDYNVISKRSTLKETYDQIISDLKRAIDLLPNNPVFVFRPSKPAAYGLLARTYLTMGNFMAAYLYADSCLQIKKDLLDYNTLDSNVEYPFSSIQYTNEEDIMHSTAADYVNYNIEPGIGKIDSILYEMYAPEDLRKSLFFRSDNGDGYYFTGNYDGGASWIAYNGLATDEVYLIKSECEARLGMLAEAMSTINTLLVNRYKQGTFKPYTPSTVQEALVYILNERRKELVYRMLRFTDIKRLNVQSANISLIRIVDGVVYQLPANDPKFALPIPNNVIQTTGMPQN